MNKSMFSVIVFLFILGCSEQNSDNHNQFLSKIIDANKVERILVSYHQGGWDFDQKFGIVRLKESATNQCNSDQRILTDKLKINFEKITREYEDGHRYPTNILNTNEIDIEKFNLNKKYVCLDKVSNGPSWKAIIIYDNILIFEALYRPHHHVYDFFYFNLIE